MILTEPENTFKTNLKFISKLGKYNKVYNKRSYQGNIKKEMIMSQVNITLISHDTAKITQFKEWNSVSRFIIQNSSTTVK